MRGKRRETPRSCGFPADAPILDAIRASRARHASTHPLKEMLVNKQELVEAVAKKLDTSKAQAGEIVDALFGMQGVIASELRKGGAVNITGFGNFVTRKRAAREGRNPQTGKTIKIKAATVPAFRAGKGLKELVNRGGKK
jgi:DNA-binding protein HU-beta